MDPQPWSSDKIKPLERPGIAYYLAQQIIATAHHAMSAQEEAHDSYASMLIATEGPEHSQRIREQHRREVKHIEYTWSDKVYQACKQALGCQDERINELEKLLLEEAMLKPTSPFLIAADVVAYQQAIKQSSSAIDTALVGKRQWFGDPLSAFCGGVVGFIVAALLACVIWRLSV